MPGNVHQFLYSAWRMTALVVCVVGLALANAQHVVAQPSFEELDALFDGVVNLGKLSAKINTLTRAGRLDEALQETETALALADKVKGPESDEFATALHKRGVIEKAMGRVQEAHASFKQALGVRRKTLNPMDADVASTVFEVAELERRAGDLAAARKLYEEALSIRERALGLDNPDRRLSLLRMVQTLWQSDEFEVAYPYYRRWLAQASNATQKSGDINGAFLQASHAIALKALETGSRPELVADLLRSMIETTEKSQENHLDVAVNYSGIGRLQQALSDPDAALVSFERALQIRQMILGPEQDSVASSLADMAGVHMVKGELKQSLALLQRSIEITARSLQEKSTEVLSLDNQLGSEPANRLWSVPAAERFQKYVDAAIELTEREPLPALIGNVFVAAQWTGASRTAASLALMAARAAAADRNLADIAREREDRLDQWRSLAAGLADRDRSLTESDLEVLARSGTRVAEIDSRLAKSFPDYARHISTEPATLKEVREHLGDEEALLLIHSPASASDGKGAVLVWAITKAAERWVRSDLSSAELAHEVAALRCGLDAAAWEGPSCAELTGQQGPDEGWNQRQPPPFDLQRSHRLYKALFGDVADVIKDKQLLIVPSGPLTTLPFQVLVTEPPLSDDLRTVRWLARDYAITVLPAVSSLKALRENAKASRAERPYIGFGNPLLDGDQKHAKWGAFYKERAEIARAQTGCAAARNLRTAALRSGVGRVVTSGGIADLEHLKFQAPLPETADELCAVAHDFGIDASEVRLGARATETEIKRLGDASDAGRLANYRILHFATHGALAGELSGTNEPGLLMTPPSKATRDDDGYLSAGEIAALKLDADWVILSACNTAGAAGQTGDAGAEALSGLARAFFYAGARALLVSHWAVDSEAAVGLITTAVGVIAKDKTIGRSEALHRAMLTMIDKGRPHQAHPSYWAPFVVVGEGGVGR